MILSTILTSVNIKRGKKMISQKHKLLQLHAQRWLYNYGCKYAATEVPNKAAMSGYFSLEEECKMISESSNGRIRYIYDALGIRKKDGKHEIIGVEVKVSKTDFQRGFCITGCNRHYLLVPDSLLPYILKCKLPDWIGVLYYDSEDEDIKCRKSAKYRDTTANPDELINTILERNSNQIRFFFLDAILRLDKEQR